VFLVSSSIAIGKPLSNPFVEDGKPLVSKIKATENPKQGILKAVDAIGGFKKIINEGDKVLVKPNYNSADTPPASTEPEFLKAIVELLYAHGAGKVVAGESSWQMLKTRKALEKTGTLATLDGTGAEIAFFDEGNYVKVDVGGEYLKHVNLTEQALDFDKLVYSCFRFHQEERQNRIPPQAPQRETRRPELGRSSEPDNYGWTRMLHIRRTFQWRSAKTKPRPSLGRPRSNGR
jgi:hypothetical protein